MDEQSIQKAIDQTLNLTSLNLVKSHIVMGQQDHFAWAMIREFAYRVDATSFTSILSTVLRKLDRKSFENINELDELEID